MLLLPAEWLSRALCNHAEVGWDGFTSWKGYVGRAVHFEAH